MFRELPANWLECWGERAGVGQGSPMTRWDATGRGWSRNWVGWGLDEQAGEKWRSAREASGGVSLGQEKALGRHRHGGKDRTTW